MSRGLGDVYKRQAIWSPRLEKNVGLSLIDRHYWLPKQSVEVHSQDNKIRLGEISSLPFI